MGCPYCGGPLSPLGQLGARAHYRCQSCGMDSSSTEETEELTDEEEEE
jgi:tRNA(Ile2) C34 agmatinyltransferase TiaS